MPNKNNITWLRDIILTILGMTLLTIISLSTSYTQKINTNTTTIKGISVSLEFIKDTLKEIKEDLRTLKNRR